MRETVSQKWQRSQVSAQEYADNKFDELYPKIAEYTEKLETLYLSGASPDAVQELAEDAAESLDCEWPYLDDYLLVSGIWRRGVLRRHESEGAMYDEIEAVSELTHTVAKSLGFIVVQDIETKLPAIKLHFEIDKSCSYTQTSVFGTRETHFQPSALGTIGELSLSPVFEIPPADVDEIRDHLARADSWYHDRTRTDSKFYDLSSRRQYDTFDKITGQVYNATPSAVSRTQVAISASVPRLYYRDMEQYGMPAASLPKDGNYWISGTLLGVSLINAWHSVRSARAAAGHRRLQKRDDLLDPDVGLCLIVEPDAKMSESPLYLPYCEAEFELDLRDPT